MTDKDPKVKGLEQYASGWVLKLAGSLLVLSVALNNIGFRLDKVLDAYSVAIVEETKAKYTANCSVDVEAQYKINELSDRLIKVESLAHEAGQ